ncbi:hypothetical protein FOA43_004127 [Brettanomyces nanus]|uniref:Uncharacterized protein n=1 Tax=Eeniella nana TaxID=13502 RepID=A0A875S745_EENNA|nr:uncharacterized protein FOA43_004127 [Brettanomyces nanus]QPG76733.1 hypothetical protein FOA43_004127 [Brettanomyces nanus]
MLFYQLIISALLLRVLAFAYSGTAAKTSNSVCEIKLYAHLFSPEMEDFGIYNLHEGAGINYMFLGSGATTMSYDKMTGVISQPLSEQYDQYLVISEDIVMMAVYEPTVKFEIKDRALMADGSADGFYACKNTSDPYHYSKDRYQLMYSKAGNLSYQSCKSVKISAVL